ncbi:MAG: Smr/MutS family protein [Burkholderiales bacterium]
MEDRDLFLLAMDGATPLKFEARAETGKKPPAIKRIADPEEIRPDGLSDFASFPEEETAFCRPGLSQSLRKLRRGQFTIAAQLDLHGMTSMEAREQLVIFLDSARAEGMRAVRIVHGKGHGSNGEPILKSKVRNWLVQIPQVLAFSEAKPGEGGSGALVVLLKTPS